MTRRWLSRDVVLKKNGAETEMHRLSVVAISDDGSIAVTPFVREIPGVEYCDSRITFVQSSDGKWVKL